MIESASHFDHSETRSIAAPPHATLFHLHIPRCGGTSLCKALASGFPKDGQLRYRDMLGFFREVRRLGSGFSKLNLVFGHFNFGIHEYSESWRYIIMVRDPVERVRSLIGYVASIPSHRLYPVFRQPTVDGIHDFYRNNLYLSPQFANGQVRQLNPYHLAGLTALDERHLDLALQQSDHSDVQIGFLESVDASLEQLSHKMQRSFAKAPRTNASPKLELPESIDDVIREYNELDCRLIEALRQRQPSSMAA